MGELHLNVYLERIKREYNVDCTVGKPQVNYRETITKRAEFDYLHKKQSGGAGQFARVIGHMEPLPEDAEQDFEFVNELVGNALDPSFVQAVEKGFKQAVNAGELTGFPVQKVRVVITDGQSHSVDSNELAFKIAALSAFKQCYMNTAPVVLEPVMQVEVTAPDEYQGTIIANINRRNGNVLNTDSQGSDCTIYAKVPLNEMFGYSTELRSMTQGKGEFTMEYMAHEPVSASQQQDIVQQLRGYR